MKTYSRSSHHRSGEGSVLVHALVGLLVLMFLSVTLLRLAHWATDHSLRQVRAAQALAAAEAACSRGLVMLEKGAVGAVPYSEEGIRLGSETMDLEIVEVGSSESGAYGTDHYEIRGTGHAGTVTRTVALGSRHDSFLSYSRFLESGGIAYNGGATLSGRIYAGGNITLSGSPVTFMEDVTCTGVIQNKHYGIYHKTPIEHASSISIEDSMETAYYRQKAQLGGLYLGNSNATLDLSLFDFSGSTPTYDGTDLGANFNGVIFGEKDISVSGVLQGQSLTIVAGDDIIITGDVRTGNTRAHVGGPVSLTFNAPTGKELVQTVNLNPLMDDNVCSAVTMRVSGPKWYRLNLYLKEDGDSIAVTTLQRPASSPPGVEREEATVLARRPLDPSSHTYEAEIHYWSKGPTSNPQSGSGVTHVWVEVSGGEPVNVGLIAKDYLYLSATTPRILTIDAALFARDANWRPIDYSDSRDRDNSHSPCYGVWDLDQDGQIERPNEDGYDEANCDQNTWTLNINGPIITKNGGSAGPWSYYGDSQNKGTRHYNYDDDIVYYQPPCFPVILSRWAVAYWREM